MKNVNRSQRNLLILLGLILAYGIFDFIKNKDEYLSFYGKKAKKQILNFNDKESTDSNKGDRVKASYTKGWKNNPFYIPVRQPRRFNVRVSTQFNLQAISFSDGNPVAMINDNIIGIGDEIGGYKVTDIMSNQVILRKGQKSKILQLK